MVKHKAVSLITNDYRKAGDIYCIISDLRKSRISFIADNGEIKNTQNKRSFKILDKKYLKKGD